jgi:hypothetical protein
MPGSTHRLQANFSLSIGKEFPAIAGLQSMCFFGTGYDAIESNRVAGGPALVTRGSPVHSSNYVSLGMRSGGAQFDVIDLNCPRDASWIASGWTGMACVRATTASGASIGNYDVVFSDQNSSSASPGQAGSVSGFGLQISNNRVIPYRNGINNTANIQLTNVQNWHILGYTVPANPTTGSQLTAWDFTENQAGQSAVVTLTGAYVIPSPAMSPHLGCDQTDNGLGQGSIDASWSMFAKGVLSQSTMAAIAASARAWLSRRLITA